MTTEAPPERRIRRFRVAYYDQPSRRRWFPVKAGTVAEAKAACRAAHPDCYIFGVREV